MLEMDLEPLQRIFDGKDEPTYIPLDVLRHITQKFDANQEIGRGGYGAVYKELLPNGAVAVKKAWITPTTKDEKFDHEVQNLFTVKHKNVVRFLGYCSITENRYGRRQGVDIKFQIWERLICFEYVSNGSLKNHITDELTGLGWHKRYTITKGICEGLHYLHDVKKMVHRDLKPDNILLDDLMVPKIADLGISKLLEDGTSKNVITNDRAFTRWYCSPEFADSGKVSRTLDIYSLGVIIIELVTGNRETPDLKKVLRKWRYRWNMSVKRTLSTFSYQQVARCIQIGLLCKNKESEKRPTISEIIECLNETETSEGQISTSRESSIGQTIPFWNDLLWIEPLELFFPFEINMQIYHTLQLTNETNSYIAFYIQTGNLLHFCTQPNIGIVPPLSGRMVGITMHAQNKAPQDMQFTVRSTKVDGDLEAEDITEDMFKNNMVDEVNLDVVFDTQLRATCAFDESREDLPHAQLRLSVPQNPKDAEASTSEISSSSSELIKVDPGELSFAFPQEEKLVSFSIKLVNITDNYVVFVPRSKEKNVALYTTYPDGAILPPRSTHEFFVTRGRKESVAQSIECIDKYLLYSTAVTEDFSKLEYGSDIHKFYETQGGQVWHRRELDVVLYPAYQEESSGRTEINPSVPKELIQVDPHELRFPYLEDHKMSVLFSVKVVNLTDYYVVFVSRYMNENLADYSPHPNGGILPPRSTQDLVVRRTAKKMVPQMMECNDKNLLFSTIVSDNFSNYNLNTFYEKTQRARIWHQKHLGVVLYPAYQQEYSNGMPYSKLNSSVPKELIQVDPRELRFPFLRDHRMSVSFSIKLVNITDYYVVFVSRYMYKNLADYSAHPNGGILPPRSTQDLVIKRTAKKTVPQSIECNDKNLLFCSIVNQDFKINDLAKLFETQVGYIWHRMELGVLLEVPSQLQPSGVMPHTEELIQVHPSELRFPFLPNEKRSASFSIKLENITDDYAVYMVVYSARNVATYDTHPKKEGILPPRSTEELVVKRTAKKTAPQSIECDDMYHIHSTAVGKDFKSSDLRRFFQTQSGQIWRKTALDIILEATPQLESSDVMPY
ncbi:unnamed protein product [Alopecurus aequalis]